MARIWPFLWGIWVTFGSYVFLLNFRQFCACSLGFAAGASPSQIRNSKEFNDLGFCWPQQQFCIVVCTSLANSDKADQRHTHTVDAGPKRQKPLELANSRLATTTYYYQLVYSKFSEVWEEKKIFQISTLFQIQIKVVYMLDEI